MSVSPSVDTPRRTGSTHLTCSSVWTCGFSPETYIPSPEMVIAATTRWQSYRTRYSPPPHHFRSDKSSMRRCYDVSSSSLTPPSEQRRQLDCTTAPPDISRNSTGSTPRGCTKFRISHRSVAWHHWVTGTVNGTTVPPFPAPPPSLNTPWMICCGWRTVVAYSCIHTHTTTQYHPRPS